MARPENTRTPLSASQISTQSVPETQLSESRTTITLPDTQPPDTQSPPQRDTYQDVLDYSPGSIPVDPRMGDPGGNQDLDLRVRDADDFTSWTDRTTTELAKDDSAAVTDHLHIPARKRKGGPHDPELTEDRRTALHNFEVSLRTLYLCDFGKTRLDLAKKWHFDHLPPSDKSYCYDKGHTKALNLFNSWKHKILKNFKAYIDALAARDRIFRNEYELRRCRQALGHAFSLDDFANVFNFVKSWIDLERSKPEVKQWCKVIWVDLGGAIKMQWNTEKGIKSQGQKQSANSNKVKYNKESIGQRFALYSRPDKYDHLRPKLACVSLYVRTVAVRAAAKADDKVTQALLDDLYIPSDDDALPDINDEDELND
ncbi:hypothetical protein HDV62DRAFT_394078 [Trichoderma sp. SZMC 28011]